MLNRKRNYLFIFSICAILLILLAFSGMEAAASTAIDGFDPNANGDVYSFAVQVDGKILAGGLFTGISGTTRNDIARLNADGTADTTFNPNANGDVWSMAVQADGKILVGGIFTGISGTTRNRIARLNPDGTADAAFNPGANNIVISMAVQADGKILTGGTFTTMSGTTRNNIARLNADGTLDTSFDPNANGGIWSIAIQADGKILVGGVFTTIGSVARNNIARLNADGTLDASFNPNADIDVLTIAVQADGKILAGGLFTTLSGTTRNRIARLNADGTLDTAFNPNADTEVDFITIQPDGKILVSGTFTTIGGQTRNHIARLNTDGTADLTFNPNVNIDVYSVVYTVAVQPDGKILAAGTFTSIGGQARNNIARLNAADGMADATFNPNADSWIYPIAVQTDGKVLVGGSFTTSIGGQTRNHIARLNADGNADLTFIPNANDDVYSIAVQADGKILTGGIFTTISGTTRNRIARLNADGTTDAAFNPNADGDVYALAVQADGKIITGGSFTTIGVTTRNRIARLNADGTLDTTFNPNADSVVDSIAIQADGKILVGGVFTSISGTARNRIARLNSDGTADTTFNPNANADVYSIAVQADGKILLGGVFTTISGTTRNYIARLNADGTADAIFNPNANAQVFSMAVQADGKILVGGIFTSINGGTTRNHIARLNADGTVDTTFDPNADNIVLSMAVQPDGKILVGGFFTTIDVQPRNYIARLSADDGALQKLAVSNDGTAITWTRGQSSPEVHDVTFERSADMSTWTLLGTGTRIAGGWQLAGQSLPLFANDYVRARGKAYGGYANGSTSLVESVRQYYLEAFTLTLTKSGAGTGSVTADSGTITWTGNSGVATYPTGSMVILTATADPNTGSGFAGWSGACAAYGTSTTCYLTMDAAMNVTASFGVRFVNLQNGTMLDTVSKLIWLKDTQCWGGNYASSDSFANALANGQCGLTDSSVAGDWHLPANYELGSIVDSGYRNTTLNLVGFNVAPSTHYWLSSPIYWAMNMTDGTMAYEQNLWNYAWPVRSGQTGASGLNLYPVATGFSATSVGATQQAPTSFTITNNNTGGTIVVSAITITGADASQFSVATGGSSPCASLTPTLGSVSNCTVNVTFTPTSAGAKSASLNVVSDGISLYSALSGTGVAGNIITVATGTGISNIAIDYSSVYWTEGSGGGGKIVKVSKIGGTPSELVTGLEYPFGITVDSVNVYWTQRNDAAAYGPGSVKSVPLSGGIVTNLATIPNAGPYTDLTVDASNVFWTDYYGSGGGGVRKVPIGGGSVTQLSSGVSGWASPIAQDATDIYWTEMWNGSINKVSKNGGAVTTLISDSNGLTGDANSIALDATYVYWTISAGTVNRILKAGGSPEVLASGLSNPTSIMIDGDSVYWTNYVDPGTINMMPKSGGAVSVIAAGQVNPTSLAADSAYLYWQVANTTIKKMSKSGVVIPVVQVSPSPSFDFGSVSTGTSSAKIITISNLGTADLVVSNITITGSTDFTVSTNTGGATCGSAAPTISAGNSCTVNITLTPSLASALTGTLVIASNDLATPSLATGLMGTGVNPAGFTLTITNSGTGSGIVTADTGTMLWSGNTGTATYNYGTAVTLTAMPAAGSLVTVWTGCDSSSGNTCTVSMVSAKNISVFFAAVPRTGQTTCFSAIGDITACAGTGQDGDMLAGVAWPSPRFTPMSAGTGTVVTDNLTGLIWSQDGGTPTVNSGSLCTGGTRTWQGALNYVACLNANNYLGYNDWRLPNVNELKSFENNSQSITATWLNEQGFVNVLPYPSYYWSSTTNASSTTSAFNVQMTGGSVSNYPKTNSYYVWPVRSGQCGSSGSSPICLPNTGQTTIYAAGDDGSKQAGVAWPSLRFSVASSGTGTVVTDNLTGLIWTQDGGTTVGLCTSGTGTRTWLGALNYVACLNTINYLDHNDWRLPNVNELNSLVNADQVSTTTWLNTQGFANAQTYNYWSSTSYANSAYSASVVYMANGSVSGNSKNDGYYVWPVRSGQTNLTVSISGTGAGSVNPDTGSITWIGNTGVASYPTGSVVTLTATPDGGSTFTGWSGACTGTGTCLVTMSTATSVTATFELAPVNGVCGSNNGQTLISSPTTSLCSTGSASSVTGGGPWNWTCGGLNAGTTASCSASLQTYTLTAPTGTGGSISPSGDIVMSYGTSTAFTLTALDGYHIAAVVNTCDGSGFTNSSNNNLSSYSYNSGTITGNCAITASFAQNYCTTAPSGLVSWWAGDGNAYDSAGNNNGTLMSGATATATGKAGQAFSVDGSNLVQAPTTGLPTGNSDRTMSAWVMINQHHTGLTSIFATYGNSSFYQSYSLGEDNLGTFFSNWGDAIRGPVLDIGVWYHIAVTNSGNAVSLYVDGSLAGSSSVTLNTPAGSSLTIGGISGDPDRAMNGAVDEVQVYSRALSAGEIAALYNSGSAGACAIPNAQVTPSPSFDFGVQIVGAISTQTFTITNTGLSDLSVSRFTTTGSADFAVTTGGGAPCSSLTTTNILAVGTACTVNVTYTPSVASAAAGTFVIVSNDPDSPSLATSLAGTGVITAFTITATSDSNGSIAPSGPKLVGANSSQDYTITPNTGYSIAAVLVDGSSVGLVSSYTFTNVITGHTIAASFILTPVNGVCGSSNGGTFTTMPGTNLCSAGTASTIIGSGPWSWTCDGLYGGTTASCSADIQTYTVTVAAGANGSINPASQLVSHGSATSFTITPDVNYHITDVLVDGSSVGAVTSYPFTNITANHTISATFALTVIDTTPPVFSSTSPAANSFVHPATMAMVYYLSEPVLSGSITIARTGGTLDSMPTFTYTMTSLDLSAGGPHNVSTGWSPVDGGVYSITFSAIDLAGNPGSLTNATVTFDSTAAYLAITSPLSSSFTNTSVVSYTLTEAIATGDIVITRTAGLADALSPYTYTLTGTDLNAGSHTVNTGAALLTGATYSFGFVNVVDRGGYTVLPEPSINVTFDAQSVAISNAQPFLKSIITNASVGYILSEGALDGTVTFTRTGGTADPSSPHSFTLLAADLAMGIHPLVDTGFVLVNGAFYTVTFQFHDKAGNPPSTVSNAMVFYDSNYANGRVGDIANEDGLNTVNEADVAKLLSVMGSRPGDPDWNPSCDLNKDNRIDQKDLMLLRMHFGE